MLQNALLRDTLLGAGLVLAAALALIVREYLDLKRHNEGTEAMQACALRIRQGVRTFLNSEYKRIVVAVALLAIGFALFSELYAGFCLLVGALFAVIVSDLGVRATTFGNVRTTNAAKEKHAISRTIRIAMKAGSIGAIAVPTFSLLGFLIIVLIGLKEGPANTTLNAFGTVTNILSARLTGYSLGFSTVAIFARVGGGTYTKAADVGADLVGKVEYNLPEDSPNNVCVLADQVGDNVNDAYGNFGDLGESLCATLMSSAVIVIQNFWGETVFMPAVLFIITLATSGLFSSIIGTQYVVLHNRRRYRWVLESSLLAKAERTPEEKEALQARIIRPGTLGIEIRVEYSPEVKNPGRELTTATFISATLTILMGAMSAKYLFHDVMMPEFRFGWASPIFAAGCGIVSSVLGGLLTSYYTSLKSPYVTKIAKMAKEGPAFVITEGLYVGNHSAFVPMVIIGISVLLAYLAAGFYGVAIAAVGVLSFVGTTLAVDALGAVADNAGGIAVMCGLDSDVRAITDEVDALGNTTAAIGKFNAIAAAAFSILTMLVAFTGNVPDLDLNNPSQFVLMVVGLIFGGGVFKEFGGTLIKNTIQLADKMAREAERQIKEFDLLNPKTKSTPDYDSAIHLISEGALKSMGKPAVLSICAPLVTGALVGSAGMFGLLLGETVVAICEALCNANSGGAWDNAKKRAEVGEEPDIESSSAAYHALVTGDTVGDVAKDVYAPCCDIGGKIGAIVATITVATFHTHNLFTFLMSLF